MCNGKSDEDFVKLKLRRYSTSSTSDLYELKMSLFDHVDPEKFLLIIRNSNMNLVATGTLDMDAKIQYLRTLVCGKALRQFDFFSL